MGRKIWQKNSQGLVLLNQVMMQDMLRVDSENERLAPWVRSLKEALKKVQQVTQQLAGDMQKISPDQVLANATCYLNMLSKVVVSWLWLRQALAAQAGLLKLAENSDSDQESQDFYEGKLQAAQYFFRWELPLMHHDAQLLLNRDTTCFDMKDASF
jgi:butyryl-CoA dehydrogenase